MYGLPVDLIFYLFYSRPAPLAASGIRRPTSVVARKSRIVWLTSCLRRGPDLEPILAPPGLPPHLRPQVLLLALPMRVILEGMLQCLSPARATSVGGGPVLCPLNVQTSETAPYLHLVGPQGEPLARTGRDKVRLY